MGPTDEIEAWVRPNVEAWAHGVRTIPPVSIIWIGDVTPD